MNTADRYSLLCRALQAHPSADDPLSGLQTQLDALDALIHRELLDLARRASPDDFAEVYIGFTRELARFREFAAYPHLGGKTVIAFGGAFSAGKSSLINSLIGQPLMAVEVDPTTALPAYVLAGEVDAIHALNTHRLRIALSDEEFTTLTHDEERLYGSEVARALSAAFIARNNFPWPNLAFIDTPGYTGDSLIGARTDASIAAAQLNSAHAIIWVVNAKQGVIPESDLEFLAQLDPGIPKLIVISRADQVNDADRDAITARMTATLTERNLRTLGVYPVSTRPRHQAMLKPLTAQLAQWNQTAQPQTFARRFKALFVRYQRGLESERQQVQWQRSRLNRLALLTEAGELQELAAELSTANGEHEQRLQAVGQQLDALRERFFAELKRIGSQAGIALPEPHEIDLLDTGLSNLPQVLAELRTARQQPEPDVRQALAALRQEGVAAHCAALVRRAPRQINALLTELCIKASPELRPALLRRAREPKAIHKALAPLHASPASLSAADIERELAPFVQSVQSTVARMFGFL